MKHTIITENQKEKVLEWTQAYFPLEVRERTAIIFTEALRKHETSEIEYYLYDLKFGTGGLRGLMGDGCGRMNPWTLGKVTLALSRFLKKAKKNPSLVIAYDSRHKSLEFAEACAQVAVGMGVRVYLFDEVTPTPILSFAVRYLKAQAGIVITASHNPPEYNGYKVYNEQGAQIVGAFQCSLEEEIEKIKDWSEIQFTQKETRLYKKNVKKISKQILKAYITTLAKEKFVTPSSNPKKKELKIVYTPLHGTGMKWMKSVLEHFGFKIILVKEQSAPDGNFPTVKYPNPEEQDALALAEELAIKTKADIFLGTDPDADRLGVGVRNEKGGYNFYNGNQIGSIFCAFLCESFYEKKIKASKDISNKNKLNGYLYKTIVTTDLQNNIARSHNVTMVEVLTGFKYIAAEMQKLDHKSSKAPKQEFIFGGEESFGYLPVNFVRDKDSLSSALLLCEILTEYGDLNAYLNQIYLRYGLFLEELRSLTFKGIEGQRFIQKSMDRIRKEKLKNWKLGERKVVEVIDFLHQTRNGKKDKKYFKNFPISDVLQFILSPQGKVTIRPSGTEPKIKLYVSLAFEKERLHNLKELEGAKKRLQDELSIVSGQFLNHTGLIGSR